MSESPLGTRVREAARHPGWQVVVAGAVLALAFPGRLAGSLGTMVLLGAAGIGVGWMWPRLPASVTQIRSAVATMLVLGFITMLALDTFWDTLTISPDWQMGDWGPQHAVLARVIDRFPDLPTWNHAVSTGDAPFELYPKLAYQITAVIAHIGGLTLDLPRAFMVVAVLVHLGICLGATAIAIRIAPRPVALVAGAMMVVESGAVAEGGPVDIFRWALLHSALALACFLVAALGVVSFLGGPRTRAALLIWVATAISVIAHPAGLLAAAAACVALLVVALLATDVPPRRAVLAIVHVVLGVALGAIVWLPLGARILEYGQHFPNQIFRASDVLESFLDHAWPKSAFGILIFAGYLGIVAGLWSRRAPVVFVAALTLVLLVGLADSPHMAFDLAGRTTARLGTVRLTALARPFLAACGAYTFALVIRHAVEGWHAASPRRRTIALAVVGILTGGLLRELPAVWTNASTRAFATTRELAPDQPGRAQLTEWARRQANRLRPDAWGRALVETDTHEHFHLTALTGLPTFHLPPQPDLLLRERIEDTSEASLRRFNVRWIISESGKALTLGDPATEQSFGSFTVREVAGWDGQFARIERGAGTVRTTRLDDDAVTIEVTGTEPVLVALGTGYYPRWRATHASGAAEPVFAVPTIEGGKLHVVAAWVAPGATTFTCDGRLPSDGKGTLVSILAVLVTVGGAIAWRSPRVRRRALRMAARTKQHVSPHVLRYGVPLTIVLLFAKGCLDELGPQPAFELGSGLRGSATVEARFGDGAWEVCAYSRISAGYECPGLLVARDGYANVINDAAPSWAFSTPAIRASAHIDGVEMRVRREVRLAGRYRLGARGDFTLTVGREAPQELHHATMDFEDKGERTIELRARVPTTDWAVSIVREDTIIPPRPFLAPPPDDAPASVRAIAQPH